MSTLKQNQVKFIEDDGDTQLQLDLNIQMIDGKRRNVFANVLMNHAIQLGEQIANAPDTEIEKLYDKLNPHQQADAPTIVQDGEPSEPNEEKRIITL